MKTKFLMPVKGEYTSIEKTPDEVFAKKQMGDGFLVTPDEGKVYAPFSGKVTVLFPAGHAYGIKNIKGVEILIHIGIDTVKMKGEGFKKHVEADDFVKKGQLLGEFDIDLIKKKGYDPVTPVVLIDSKNVEVLKKKEKDGRDQLKVSIES